MIHVLLSGVQLNTSHANHKPLRCTTHSSACSSKQGPSLQARLLHAITGSSLHKHLTQHPTFLCVRGFKQSSTMRMRLHVRAVEMTWRPRPLPSFAPSMIPGRSSIWILAPAGSSTLSTRRRGSECGCGTSNKTKSRHCSSWGASSSTLQTHTPGSLAK